jgi:hypothetical protein
MRSAKGLLLAAIITAGLAGCQGYGKEYKLDKKHNVYYKGDGLTEDHAKKLANYLKEQEYFQDSIESTVQITKNKDTFNLNFVVDPAKLTEQSGNNFLLFGAFISEKVFNKAPVTINLTNTHLESVRNLGYAKPLSDSDK